MTRAQKVKLQGKMRRIRNHVALHRDTLPLYLAQPEVKAVEIIERAMRQVNAIKVKP